MDLPGDLTPDEVDDRFAVLTAELRAEVAASRRNRRGRRAAYMVVVVMGALGLWQVRDLQVDQRAEIDRDAVESCRTGNETRQTIRQMAKDTALEVGESIIEVASQGEDPVPEETVAQFRGIMARRLDAIVAQLEDRNCNEVGE